MSKQRTRTQLDPAERILWQKYSIERDQETRNILWERYHYIACATVYRRPLPPSVDRDDAVSACSLSLVKAIEAFDLKKNVLPATYLTLRCRYALVDYLREIDTASRLQRTREASIDRLRTDLEHEPNSEELYDNLAIKTRIPRTISIDAEIETRAGVKAVRLAEVLETREHSDSLSDCSWILSSLPMRERLMLLLYWVDEMPMHKVAEQLGVSESRISQMMKTALEKLRCRVTAA